MMSSEVPVLIKRNVQALLSSKFGGIPMSEFLSDYYCLLHEPLKFRELGFPSVQSFLKSIPDVARMMMTEESEVMIFGVEKPDLYMSAIPIKTPGCLPKNDAKNAVEFSDMNGIPSLLTVSPIRDYGIEPDNDGLWSVRMPIKLCPMRKPEALKAIFSQAGQVIKTKFTERWVFIRFARIEEAIIATQLFGDLEVHMVKSTQKEKHNDEKTVVSDGMSNRTNGKAFEAMQSSRGNSSKLHRDVGNAVYDRSVNIEKDIALTEKLYERPLIDKALNGYHKEQGNQNGFFSTSSSGPYLTHRDNRPRLVSISTDSRAEKTSLFVSNIESEDAFREMIRPYHPVSLEVKASKGKMIAFVKTNTEDDANRAVENLNNRWQKTKCLYIKFDKLHDKSDSDSISDGSSTDSHPAVRSNMMAVYTDMPPLIHLSELGHDADSYQLDCSIYVANFPFNTLESVLRNAFVKYHVLDICMINNGSGSGCTKAFLYLLSVYDVIAAVTEMNGSCIFETSLKVDVPFKNTILRAVVEKEKLKSRTSRLSQTSIGNGY